MTLLAARGPIRLHRGWAVLAVAFLGQMCAIGCISYGYGLLVVPLSSEFGLSRADANGGLMLLIVGMGLVSPLIGRLLDRAPARIVVVGGALAFGLGLVLISRLASLPALAAGALVVAVGGAALGPLTASTLAVRWFPQAQGRALGIIAVSSSVGGLVMLPIMALLLETRGWRDMLLVLGIGVGGTIALLGLLVVRDRPRGIVADGSVRAAGGRVGPLWRMRDFWLIAIAFGTVQGVDQALLATLIPYATGRGFDLVAASLLISVVSASSIAGKLLIGWLADRIDPRRLFCAVAWLTSLFLILLLFHPGYPTLVAACAIVGAAVGGTMPLWGALIVERFGTRSCGTVMGLLMPCQMPITIGCLRYIGHVFDTTGAYTLGFATFLGPVAIAGVAMLALGRRPAERPAGLAAAAA